MRQETELQNIKEYGFLKQRYVKQVLLWSALYVMITRRVNFQKAQATVLHEYWKKCNSTGEANYFYRPPNPLLGEIGPQRQFDWGGIDWWLLLIIALVLRWLYKKYKK